MLTYIILTITLIGTIITAYSRVVSEDKKQLRNILVIAGIIVSVLSTIASGISTYNDKQNSQKAQIELTNQVTGLHKLIDSVSDKLKENGDHNTRKIALFLASSADQIVKNDNDTLERVMNVYLEKYNQTLKLELGSTTSTIQQSFEPNINNKIQDYLNTTVTTKIATVTDKVDNIKKETEKLKSIEERLSKLEQNTAAISKIDSIDTNLSKLSNNIEALKNASQP